MALGAGVTPIDALRMSGTTVSNLVTDGTTAASNTWTLYTGKAVEEAIQARGGGSGGTGTVDQVARDAIAVLETNTATAAQGALADTALQDFSTLTGADVSAAGGLTNATAFDAAGTAAGLAADLYPRSNPSNYITLAEVPAADVSVWSGYAATALVSRVVACDLVVTGAISPDATGVYRVNGTHNGSNAYERVDGAYWIYYEAPSWVLGSALGSGLWSGPEASAVGDYTEGGSSTGTAYVIAGPLTVQTGTDADGDTILPPAHRVQVGTDTMADLLDGKSGTGHVHAAYVDTSDTDYLAALTNLTAGAGISISGSGRTREVTSTVTDTDTVRGAGLGLVATSTNLAINVTNAWQSGYVLKSVNAGTNWYWAADSTGSGVADTWAASNNLWTGSNRFSGVIVLNTGAVLTAGQVLKSDGAGKFYAAADSEGSGIDASTATNIAETVVGQYTNKIDVALSYTNGTTHGDGVLGGTNGVYWGRGTTNYWILFEE
jgi:hypothetical protein